MSLRPLEDFRLHGPLPQKRVTVAIPFRAGKQRPDLLTRIENVLLDRELPRDQFDFVIADDGSASETRPATIELCERLGMTYLAIESQGQPFSRARACNAAAMVSGSGYILFFDADLMPYDGFYREVLNEITVQELDQNSRRFLMFPAIYLSKSGSEEFQRTPPALRRQEFLQRALLGSESVEKVSTGTSIILVNREHYRAIGGMSEDFQCWGFEDQEVICRLMFLAKDFPEPVKPLVTHKSFWNITEYRGWRAMYRLYGELTYRKGMALFHCWHASPTENKKANEQLFNEKLVAFYQRGETPPPLPALTPASGHAPYREGAPWKVKNFTNSGLFGSYLPLARRFLRQLPGARK